MIIVRAIIRNRMTFIAGSMDVMAEQVLFGVTTMHGLREAIQETRLTRLHVRSVLTVWEED